MNPTASKLVKVTVFVSACAGIAYVTHVASREVAYVHAKISGSPNLDTRRNDFRWPEGTAGLPELRVSLLKTKEQPGAEDR
ncbi:hypothetical protein [Pseudomonas fluorescens]|uniref:hypothetical protein n=1 Tax=Pseudomonas fluorescens TaxID=294 RepID=UPI001BE76D34|nr:hypothetical protein [Pseudomonas fluorescens]MBT2372330.1 hypothetical protein [Pseudomonas fluorescens]